MLGKKFLGGVDTSDQVLKNCSLLRKSLLAVHSGHLQLVLSALQGCCPAPLPSWIQKAAGQSTRQVFTQCSSASWKRKEGPQPTWAMDWHAPPGLQCRQMTATAVWLCGMQPAEEGLSSIQEEAICLHVWTASGHLMCSSQFLGLSYHKWLPVNSQVAGGRSSLGWC